MEQKSNSKKQHNLFDFNTLMHIYGFHMNFTSNFHVFCQWYSDFYVCTFSVTHAQNSCSDPHDATVVARVKPLISCVRMIFGIRMAETRGSSEITA